MIETRRQGLPDKAERNLLRKDGTEIWVLVSATPIMDEIEGFQGSFSMLTDITERKKAEIALRKSEERFRLILENMPILLNAFDDEGNIISWNKACEVATGYKEEEAKSNPKIMELLYPDPDYRTLVWKASSDQLKQNNAFDLVAKDGNIHTIEWFDTYHILKIPGWDSWGMGLDITERNQAQTALKESEDRFRNMADLLPQAIFETDIKGRLTYVNKTAYELFRYTQDDFDNGLLAFDMVIPEDRELAYRNMESLINERNFSKTEYTALRKDGLKFPVIIYTNAIIQNNKSLGLRGIIFDMTEIKLAEKKIKLSEERLKKLIGSVTDYIFTVNIENNIVKETIHSEGCYAVTGYYANEFYNDNYLWFKIVLKEDMGIVKQQATDLVQNKIENTIEHRIIHKSGTIRWVSNTPVLRFNPEGELIGYDGLIADITARKIAEAALFESETRYRLIATLSGHIVYECNLNDNTIIWGGAIQQVTGYTPFEYKNVTKKEWAEMVHPEDKNRLLDLYQEFVNKEKNFKVEYRYKNKGGSYIWIEEESFIFPETANKISKVVGVMKDITNKKSLERQILNSVIETEERERLNFSQELHDGIGPLLSATKMYIQWLGLPNAKLDQSDILKDVEKLLDESTKTVREISFKLSPHILQNYGLVEALNAYIEKVQESSRIKIDMNLKNFCRFNEKAEIIVYRVICECINNTVKHAKASSIIINLICQNNLLLVEYIDNGQGFDVENVITEHKGIGLLNMQSRLKSINGLMNIVSSPNNGTSIKFQINIHDN
jgi:PAS domain S-box-containing protein